MKNKKTLRIQIIILLISIITIIGSVSYAYLGPVIGLSSKAGVNVRTGTVDSLTFDKCDPISLSATNANFKTGDSNIESNTCVKATLTANNDTNTATENYNVYLDIKINVFKYTTTDNRPEIILQVTDPNGNAVTSIPNLIYNTELQGFDITTKRGLIELTSSYEIKVNNKNENPKTQEWKLKVILINLESDQSSNAGKTFNAEIDIQKETITKATFDTGENVNTKMKTLAKGSAVSSYATEDNLIKAIVEADTLPNNFTPTTANTVSTSTSEKPVYMWFEEDATTNDGTGTIYYYSEANRIYLNEESSYMFMYCYNLSNIDALSNWNTSNVTNMYWMFRACLNLSNINALSNWDSSNVENMGVMFQACRNITNIDALSNWDPSSVTDMSHMFSDCRNLTNIDALSNWDTSSVTKMNGMFDDCINLSNIDALSNWDTSSVTNMQSMFHRCINLSNIDALSNWDTSSVTDMHSMFLRCGNLTNIDALSNWDTSSVTDMQSMFSGCSKATGTIQILGNPTSYSTMFNGAATTGSGITVNYGSATTNIDAIIATKTGNSNVVKGVQVN